MSFVPNPLLPLFIPVWAVATDARSPFLTSFSAFFSFTLLKPTPIHHPPLFVRSQVVSKLVQIREYISKASSMRDDLVEKNDVPANVERLSHLIDHLREQEKSYLRFLQNMLVSLSFVSSWSFQCSSLLCSCCQSKIYNFSKMCSFMCKASFSANSLLKWNLFVFILAACHTYIFNGCLSLWPGMLQAVNSCFMWW